MPNLAILLPLALIVGIYGMNGLDLKNIGAIPVGFPVVIATMGILTLGLILFFIKKKWLLVKEPKISNQRFTEKQVNSQKSRLEKKES